jgi:cell division septation protein DedD
MIRPTQHARRHAAYLAAAAVALGSASFIVGGQSLTASAHHVTSVSVECNADGGVATVNVAGWTGDVILSTGAEGTPLPPGGNGHVTFTGLANGTYHLYREPDEIDVAGKENLSGDNSGQQTFVVNCEEQTPSPTPTATPTPTPSETPTPTSTPTPTPVVPTPAPTPATPDVVPPPVPDTGGGVGRG